MVIKDPLTRKKFNIKESDSIYEMAQKTVQLHSLGEEQSEEYNQCRTKRTLLQSIGQNLMQTIGNITAVSEPIKANVVNE